MVSALLSDFLGILRESQQIFLRNKRLIASIILFTLLLYSIYFISNFFSIKPLIFDLVTKATLLFFTDPRSSQFAKYFTAMIFDIKSFALVEWLFTFAIFIFSSFTSTTIILASEISSQVSFKNLLSRVLTSCKRALVTWFCVNLFNLGYLLLTILLIFPFMLNFNGYSHPSSSIPQILLLLIATVINMYLGAYWNIALVVSVLEEKCGFETIGKAGQLLKGMKLLGFLLSLLFGVTSYAVSVGYSKIIMIKPITEGKIVFLGIVASCLIGLVKMLKLMAFRVFYHACKKTHGEETEFKGNNVEYIKIPIAQLVGSTEEVP